MKQLSLRTHNILDYVIGSSLMATPFASGMTDVPAARNIFMTLGSGLIGYSLCTNYRYSVAKFIPIGVHMTMDVASGLTLMAAPFAFKYQKKLSPLQIGIHFLFGLGAIGLVTITRSRSETTATVKDRKELGHHRMKGVASAAGLKKFA